jgi:hypothetical protein
LSTKSRLGVGVALGHRHARLVRQPLDRLGEGKPLGLHEEGENVAVLAGGEIEPPALRVIDEEGRAFLLVEGREAGELAALLPKLHAPADHRRGRQAGADFFEEGGREAHG